MNNKFNVTLAKFVKTGNGTDVEPVPLHRWTGLSQLETMDIFTQWIRSHPGAVPDSDNSIDSVVWGDDTGQLYNLFVEGAPI